MSRNLDGEEQLRDFQNALAHTWRAGLIEVPVASPGQALWRG
jgi:hypothetical protein